MNNQTANSVAGIVAIVKANLANGTAVIGPTHYDNAGNPIDLSGRKASQTTNRRRRFIRHRSGTGRSGSTDRTERRSEMEPIQGLFGASLPPAGGADGKYFPRVESVLVVTDSCTGRAITLDREEEALLFRALQECRNGNAARLAARLDAL
ncbi:MAG: hypothetical protein H8F28_24530 [Fibrella sp.]|nr:hypothetical protein [Armatimonadota bacterium]